MLEDVSISALHSALTGLAARQRAGLISLVDQEFGECEDLLREAHRVGIVGKESRQFIAKGRDTARFHSHDRHACAYVIAQGVERLTPEPLGAIEHPQS